MRVGDNGDDKAFPVCGIMLVDGDFVPDIPFAWKNLGGP
jgi:hypothetical protein